MKYCAITLFVLVLSSCGGEEAALDPVPPLSDFATAFEAAGTLKLEEKSPEEYPDLHNLFRLSENIISGSEPHGEEALERLAGMGVKTLLSVDGKMPDAKAAEKLGMRYVHVPIRYRGVTGDEMMRIAKTFREMEGPFFVHCFHGKHRGPTAAAIGRVVLDGASREQALAEMRQWCGTSEKYEGLYRVLASDAIPAVALTKEYAWDFPEAQSFSGFREAMIEIARAWDHLKLLSKRDWKMDPLHPDVDALNESEKLSGLFEQALNLDEVKAKPEDFRGWMADSAKESGLLRGLLGDGAADVKAVFKAFDAVGGLCGKCHAAYRNE